MNMHSKPMRILVALLFFFLGVFSLYSALDGALDLKPEPFSWISLISSSLLVLSAYGLFRQCASARYAMYAYLAITLLAGGFIALEMALAWQLVVACIFALLATLYVHQHFHAANIQPARLHSRLKESAFLLIYGAVVFSCLLVTSLTKEPTMKTLSGPVSVRE